MSDLNKEALDIWGGLKPMIDQEISSRTQGMVQRRKAKVTTAPSLVTNTIGVTEAFGQEIFLPFVSNMISANVGDFVWIEWMYGATNAFVSSFASADTKNQTVAGDLTVIGNATVGGNMSATGDMTADDVTVGGVLNVVPRRCYATLSSAGWYRVMDVAVSNANASKFSVATIVDINIGTEYWANSNGTHKISLHGVFNNPAFVGEESKSNYMLVSKIRYTYDSSGNGHIDIYYTGTSGNPVWCTFTVHMPYTYQHWFVANSFSAVGPSPANETVLTEYEFTANGIRTVTLTSAHGSVTLNGQKVAQSGKVVSLWVDFTVSTSISGYAYLINAPTFATDANALVYDTFGTTVQTNVRLYADEGNNGLRCYSSFPAGRYTAFITYITTDV